MPSICVIEIARLVKVLKKSKLYNAPTSGGIQRRVDVAGDDERLPNIVDEKI